MSFDNSFDDDTAGGGAGGVKFTDCFFSKANFKDLYEGSIKTSQQDDKFLDLVQKYTAVLKKTASDLDKLKKDYNSKSAKCGKGGSANAMDSFVEHIDMQAQAISNFVLNITGQAFTSTLKNSLTEQKKEAQKLSDEVEKKEKEMKSLINNVKSHRKTSFNKLAGCEQVEMNRPQTTEPTSKEWQKYTKERVEAKKKLVHADEAFFKSCLDANEQRFHFEKLLGANIEKFQELSEKRSELMRIAFTNYCTQFTSFSQSFARTIDEVQATSLRICSADEAQAFVDFFCKDAQNLSPEIIVYDRPNHDPNPASNTSVDTTKYSVAQIRKALNIDRIKWLQKKEAKTLKDIPGILLLLAKTQVTPSFSNLEDTQMKISALFSELDIIQTAIRSIVEEHVRDRPGKADTSHMGPESFQWLKPVKDNRGNAEYFIVQPPLEYYWNNERTVAALELPALVLQDMEGVIEESMGGSLGGSFTSMGNSRSTLQDLQQSNDSFASNNSGGGGGGVQDSSVTPVGDDDDEFTYKSRVTFAFDPAETYPDMADTSYMLPLEEGEVVTVLETLDQDWVNARNSRGRVGHAPSAFLQPI